MGAVSNHSCRFEEAMLLFKNADFDEASALFHSCELGREYIKEASFFHGISLRNSGQVAQAIEQLKKARKTDPTNLNVINELAITFEQSKKYLDAQNLYEEVLALEPNNFAAKLGVARMQHWRGRIENSIESYEGLLHEKPDDLAVMLGLGYVLISNYELDEAKKLFNAVLRNNNNESAALQGLSMLKNITKNQFKIKHQFDAGKNTQVKSTSIFYRHQYNYRTSWGVEYLENNLGQNPLSENGIIENRKIKKEFSLFTARQFTPKLNGMIKLTKRSSFNHTDIIKNQYELGYRINESLSGHFGQTYEWSDGDLINLLSFTGLEYVNLNNYTVSGQFFYSGDEEFGDSQALSLKLKKYFSETSWFQLGVSERFAQSQNATTVFGKYSWFLNDNLNLFVDGVTNLNEDESTLGFGLNYNF